MIKEAVLGNPLISVYRTTTRERTTKYVDNLWQTRLTWGSPDGGERRRPTLTRGPYSLYPIVALEHRVE